MPVMEQAISKARVLIAPPNMCSFSTQGVEVNVEDGFIATRDVGVIQACLDHGFMEASDPKDMKRVRRIMADRMKREVIKRSKDNGDDDSIAMDKAIQALTEAGFIEADVDSELAPEPEDDASPAVAAKGGKKPKAKAED